MAEPKVVAQIDEWRLKQYGAMYAQRAEDRNGPATIVQFEDDGALAVTIGTLAAGHFRATIPSAVLERLLADRDARRAKAGT